MAHRPPAPETASKSPLPDLVAELQLRLFQGACNLVQMVSCRDEQDAWRILNNEFGKVLKADQVAFLVMDETADTKLLRVGRVSVPGVVAVRDGPALSADELRALQELLQKRAQQNERFWLDSADVAEFDKRLFEPHRPESTLWCVVHDRSQILGVLVAARWHPRTVRPKDPSFGDDDLKAAQWFAQATARVLRLMQHDDAVLHLNSWEIELTRDDARTIACKLKSRIKNTLPLDGVIVYVLIPRTMNLMSIDGIDPANRRDLKKKPYIYLADDDSASTWAFKNGAFSCKNPWKDPDPRDKGKNRCNKTGLKAFKIKGSLFAVPFGEHGKTGKPDKVFGSVIAWHSTEQFDDNKRAVIEQQLRKLVAHATNPMRLALSTRKAELQDRAADIMRQMMAGADLKCTLNAILDAIHRFGFRRVRLYGFRYGDTLEGVMSKGMGKRSKKFGGRKSDRIRVNIFKNDYTKIMYDGICLARWRDPKSKPGDLQARLNPTKGPDGRMLKDNTAKQVGRPIQVPWAEVPIVLGGKFFGLIAADKLVEKNGRSAAKEWEQILEMDLDALDVMARLASQAFALEERRGMLFQKTLRILDDHVGLDVDLELVQRRLLLYAAHGEQGLGFSRTFLFVPAGDKPGEYQFCHAVGGATGNEHERNIQAARTMSLDSVLEEAELPKLASRAHDRALNDCLQELRLDIPKRAPAVIRHNTDAAGTPDWIRSICVRIGERGGEPPAEIAATRVRAGTRDLGWIVVDRQWDDARLIEADDEVLESFGRHAAQILLRHQALQDRVTAIDKAIQTICHDLESKLGGVESALSGALLLLDGLDLAKLHHILASARLGFANASSSLGSVAASMLLTLDGAIQALAAIENKEFEESLQSIKAKVYDVTDNFRTLPKVMKAQPELTPFRWSELVQALQRQLAPILSQLQAKGIQIAFEEPEPAESLRINLESIVYVLRNILHNAMDAFDVAKKQGGKAKTNGPPRVVVSAEVISHGRGKRVLEVHIDNNGPNIDRSLLRELNRPDSVLTTKGGRRDDGRDGKPGGLGLFLSRYVLRRFGGMLKLDSPLKKGSPLAQRSLKQARPRGVRAALTLTLPD